MKKVHSLRTTLLRIILIPAIAVLFIVLGVILVSAVLLQNEIVERQRQLIEALGRQGNQYLAETDRIMRTLAEAMPDMSPESQIVLLKQARRNYPRFAALYLLDETGRVLVEDTDATSLLNLDLSGAHFFRRARELERTFFSESFISPTTGQVSVTGAVPITDGNRLKGMLIGELNLVILQRTIEEANTGAGQVSFIVDQRGTLVAHANPQWVQEQRNLGNLALVQKGLSGQEAFEIFYDGDQAEWLWGSALPMRQAWVAVTTQSVAIAARPLITLAVVSGLAFLLSCLLFAWIQVSSLRQITSPISLLADRADALARGQYGHLPVESTGIFREVQSLGQSFNRMVEVVTERDRLLEQRVADRTHRLQIVATLGEHLNAILHPDQLLETVVAQVQANLHYYHVGVFMLDVSQENLELKAATGKTDSDLLATGYSVRLDADKSLVACAARAAQVVCLDDVQYASDWLPCHLLPDTRSEIALPIMAQDQVMGVLDVQDDQLAAFDASGADTLRSLANQIGVALHNAHLYTEMEHLVAQRTADLMAANQALKNELQERRRAEEQIRASLQEKQVLLQEIHHRVKNNLQIIYSLLNLQAARVHDPAARQALRESQGRIRSMALVHERLYQSESLSRIDFSNYVRQLAMNLYHSYQTGAGGVQIDASIHDIFLDIDTAIPCGLLINELVSNSFKHAFPPDAPWDETLERRIWIEFERHGDQLELTVGDNGVSFPPDLDFRNTESLGLQLVMTLVKQLDGDIQLERRGWTVFRVVFPAPRFDTGVTKIG